jgi:hypothetical protein
MRSDCILIRTLVHYYIRILHKCGGTNNNFASINDEKLTTHYTIIIIIDETNDEACSVLKSDKCT